MTKTQLLCVIAVLAAGAIVAGVAVLTRNPGWALVAGGILALVGVGLLYDPAERRPG